jgi:ABC-type multidrug transport system ATPase subunit
VAKNQGRLKELKFLVSRLSLDISDPQSSVTFLLRFKEPAVYVVLGPSGAGKTTLFRTLSGILRPYHGQVYIGGEPIEGQVSRNHRYIALADIVGTNCLTAEDKLYRKLRGKKLLLLLGALDHDWNLPRES